MKVQNSTTRVILVDDIYTQFYSNAHSYQFNSIQSINQSINQYRGMDLNPTLTQHPQGPRFDVEPFPVPKGPHNPT